MSTPDFENISDEELMGLNPGDGDDISAALNGEESGPAEPMNPGGDDPEPEEQQDASPELVGSEEDDQQGQTSREPRIAFGQHEE